MFKIFKKIIEYPLKRTIPIFTTIGIIITFVILFILLLHFLNHLYEMYIINQIEFYKKYLSKTLTKEQLLEKEIISDIIFIHNTFNTEEIFVINIKTKKIIFSTDSYYTNNDIKILDFTKYHDLIDLISTPDIIPTYHTNLTLSSNENLFKIQNRYIYVYHNPENNWKIFLIYNKDISNFIINREIIPKIIMILIISVIPFLTFYGFYKLYFKTRIENILNFIKEISKNNFDLRIPIEGKDEISYISSFLNQIIDKIENFLLFDSLTKVYNRYGFELLVNKILKKIDSGVIFFMDLDGFKYINESFGHNIGDIALKIVSERLRSICEKNPLGIKIILGRIGGDEFALFFSSKLDYKNYLDIQIFAMKVIEIISEKIKINEMDLNLGISIGIAIYPKDGKSLNELLTNSDLAMYHSKYTSKNTFHFFDKNIKELYEEKNLLRNSLISIFKNKNLQEHFYIVYQPIISIKENKISHLEVLARFNHSKINSDPSKFIPLLEELNFIEEFGYYIIEKSLIDFSEIKNYGIDKISINLSVNQLKSGRFFNNLKQLIKNFSVFPENIIFEITETSFMKEPNRIINAINSLYDASFSFALDDFGTGYSSLQYIKDLPIEYIKIDKIFVKDIFLNEKSYNIFKSFVNLSKSLNLKTIAEGVQDVNSFKILQELDCDYAQGYLISKPLEKKDLIKFIIKNNIKIL